MEKAAQNKLVDFMYPLYLLQDDYDILMNDYDYAERAYRVFREIGNIISVQHSYEATIDSNGKVELPCNLEYIEAVTNDPKIYDHVDKSLVVSYFHTTQDYPSANATVRDLVSDRSLIRQLNDSKSYSYGEFMNYEIINFNEALQFSPELSGQDVYIIYKGILVDKAGNPLLNIKEAEAIASKLALREMTKRAFKGDPLAANSLALIKAETTRLMAAAKVPEYINQNFINEMLRTVTRHDRKVYWSSYKTIQ